MINKQAEKIEKLEDRLNSNYEKHGEKLEKELKISNQKLQEMEFKVKVQEITIKSLKDKIDDRLSRSDTHFSIEHIKKAVKEVKEKVNNLVDCGSNMSRLTAKNQFLESQLLHWGL